MHGMIVCSDVSSAKSRRGKGPLPLMTRLVDKSIVRFPDCRMETSRDLSNDVYMHSDGMSYAGTARPFGVTRFAGRGVCCT